MYILFLNINAICLLIAVFFIKEHNNIKVMKDYILYALCLGVPILFTGICLLLTRQLSREEIEGGIKEVELVDGTYLPIFLGYFFVGLSIKDFETLIVISIVVLLFTYSSQTLFFNPLFLVFGYRFYYITVDNGMKIFVLSKRKIRSIDGLNFRCLRRINDYTYIDRGNK